MNQRIKCGLISGIIGQFAAFAIILITTLVTLSRDDPAPLAQVSGYIALVSGAAVCGLVSSVKCKNDLISPIFSSIVYISIQIILSTVFSGFENGIGLFKSPSVVQKLLAYGIVVFISFFVSFLLRKKKPKKRSASSVKTSMAKNYKHLRRA